jgi:glycosyltransferase involved in cell wall biosynthesis
MTHSIRVAMLYDKGTWVLGYIARSLAEHANAAGVLEITPMQAIRRRSELAGLMGRFDVVHYLSPGDFYRLGMATPMASVVTLHHVATRVRERFNAMAHHADVACVINSECEGLVKGLPGVAGTPLVRTAFGIDINTWRPTAGGRELLLRLGGLPDDALLLGLAAKKDSDEDDRKGFDRTWEMLRQLRARHGDRVRLVLFGPGPEKPYGWHPEDIPADVRAGVFMPGFRPAEELPALYAGLDFYVCLSRIEGGPYPVMEAMACGTPVISTAVGIVPDLVRDGVNGFLVDGDNFVARIDALVTERLAGVDFHARIGPAARATIERERHWPLLATTELYAGIYHLAMARYAVRPLPQRLHRHFRVRWAQITKPPKPGAGDA